MKTACLNTLLLILLAPTAGFAAEASETEATQLNIPIVIGFILFFVVVSIVITWWTSRSTKSASDFYVAGKGVPWMQVGIAMVGSYLSAASFLGCAGDIGVFGIDSIWLSIGFFGGYMAVLLLIAGPLRNIGAFTVAGALYSRYPDDRIKLVVMLCTVVISTFYLVPQMLGAGLLFELLLHWDFVWVTIGLGVLMSIYIIFGGMKATLYNQVIQALFLWGTMVVLVTMAYFTVGEGSFDRILTTAHQAVPPIIAAKNPAVVEAIKHLPADQAIATARQMLPAAESAMTIGVKTSSTLAMVSTVIALVFGTAGLPHILIMFFTVPSARAAKKSVALCIVALGIFYLAAIILGFLLFPGIYSKLVSWIAQGPVGVGMAKNMAVLEISHVVGGNWLMAIGAAGAVAAVLSTSAGLMITVASSISQDLYKVYINPKASEKQELAIAKVTTLLMSAVAVSLAVLLKQENIAWLVMLAFGIAASAIFPAMLCTLWWKRTTRQAVIASILTGLGVSVLFIVLLFVKGANYTLLGLSVAGGPGLFGVVASFIVLLVVTQITTDTGKDPESFMTLAHRPDVD
ncbi:MAG: cation acetate symporter [Desulfobacterales bacterium]|jgi:cation/acetate symporter|nr:cation acetate symporter [Desulfobacterales bacterium]